MSMNDISRNIWTPHPHCLVLDKPRKPSQNDRNIVDRYVKPWSSIRSLYSFEEKPQTNKRHCVFYGVESWSGVLEWSHRVESWRQMLEWIGRLKLKQSQSIFYNIARHFRCGCKCIYYHLDIFLGQPQT